MNDLKHSSTFMTIVEHGDIIYPSAIPFVLIHLACLSIFWTGVTFRAITICLVLYWLRMFAVTAGYHRYFSHRAYRTSRVFQFILAVMSQSSAQQSVLWWAAMHRHHHLYSDTEMDVHSPSHKGLIYSHIGWVFARVNNKADLAKIADFACYPELMWLHRHERVPPLLLALLSFVIGGWSGLVVGFLLSTVLLYHASLCINSLAHVRGRKRYVTGDDSRNNWMLAVFTMGEGWHNNHHAYPSSARQGFRWWEIDATFYVLKALERLGLVWDLKAPPAAVRRNEHRLGSRTIERAAVRLAQSFDPDLIAGTIASACTGSALAAIQEKLVIVQHCGAEVLADVHLPHFPTRHEVLSRALAIFTDTPSIEEIVNRSQTILLDSIRARLSTMPQQIESRAQTVTGIAESYWTHP